MQRPVQDKVGMTPETTTEDAVARISVLLSDAPAHVRERWAEVDAYLQASASDDGEIAAATPYEDDLLQQMSVSAHMFDGGMRNVEITIGLPFQVTEWFNGHSHFEFDDEAGGKGESERMLSFYRRQEAEKKRLVALIRSSVAPIAFDCLCRMIDRDIRRGKDDTLFDMRHAIWRSAGRSGPEPYPEGGQPPRTVSVRHGVACG